MPPSTQTPYRKKLIEVDLPLDAINSASTREKSIQHGHPSTMHRWWARRPLAACRAVIFASLVDDPSACPEDYPDEDSQRAKRTQLHEIIKKLVVWENSHVDDLLEEARLEIAKSVSRSLQSSNPISDEEIIANLDDFAPAIYDPFCGGGSIPLEAQRLGLHAIGSDLNPIAVLISRALVEIPRSLANSLPVNPLADPLGITAYKGKRQKQSPWRGLSGLADDIRYYGKWMKDRAFERIGHLYPRANLSDGSEATVVAWIWARTVPCPNPACNLNMPLMKTFQLSKKKNNHHWARPIVDRGAKNISFQVQAHDTEVPVNGTVNRNGATCVGCGNSVGLPYVREQAKAGNMRRQMVAIVAASNRKKTFISPDDRHVHTSELADPEWKPPQTIPATPKVSALSYGATHWHQLFTDRQLTALTTFSDLVNETRSRIVDDGADESHADIICTYLAFTVSKCADYSSSYASWNAPNEQMRYVFGRQAIPMIWDFTEVNLFSQTTGNWLAHIDWVARAVENLPYNAKAGQIIQSDAATISKDLRQSIIITDPPYYDNISYAALSDFFYVWLRRLLRDTYPELFTAMLTPKDEEMIADARFDNPKRRFEFSLRTALSVINSQCNDDYPSAVFYAYKQQKEEKDGQTSTGWETFLNALIDAGFQITATWPMRTERPARSNAMGANALASSVVLSVRRRDADAQTATRQEFLDELHPAIHQSLDHLTREGHISPADLRQSAIGPGMEVYSKYGRIETVSGEVVTVRDALQQINQTIDGFFDSETGELDALSRFCVDWLKTHEYKERRYGDADNASRANNTSVSDIADIHQLVDNQQRGIIQLHPISQYHPDRKYPMTDITAWEGCMRMAYHLDTSNEDGEGIPGCGEIGRLMAGNIDSIERLARILYNHYDNLNQPGDAYIYNQLVSEWQNILDASQSPEQGQLN